MAEVRLYIVEAESNRAEATKIAQASARRLETKELTLLQLVESLGEFLNNDRPITRERAMSYLAEVIAATPNGVFTLQHRKVLLEFITSRLTDHEVGIGSCAKALLALEERGKWDAQQVSTVMDSLLRDTPQLLHRGSQSQRYQVYLLLDLLFAKYRQPISDIHLKNLNFLRQLIEYFVGEKDPRNLMIVFSVLLVIMTEWDISICVQDVFNAVFDYFPISYRPPADDTSGVTAEALKDRVQACIASTSAFAPYAFPALLDKLDLTSPNTKRDAMKILEAAANNYGARTMALYAITLWDAIKFEILQVQDEERAELSLDVLISIGKTLSTGPAEGLATYLKPVVKECNEHLEDAPTKQSDAACRILAAISSASRSTCNAIISGTLPHLFQLVQTSNSVPKQRSLVQVLKNLLQSDCELFGDWQHVPFDPSTSPAHATDLSPPENGLKHYSKSVLDFLQTSLGQTPVTEVSLRLVLVDASLQLVKIRDLLSDEQISQVIKLLNHIVIDEESYTKDAVKTVSMDALLEIAHQKPHIIIETTFPALMSRIPDTDSGTEERYIPILEAFAKISIEERLFSTSLIRLKHRVLAAVHQKASAIYLQSILSTILYIFQNANPKLLEEAASPSAYKDMVLPLLTQVCPTMSLDQRQDLTYALIGKISNEVIRIQPANIQSEFASKIYTISWSLPLSEVSPFSSEHSAEKTRHLLVSLYLLAALRREVHIPYETHKLLDALVAVINAAEPSTSVKAGSLLQISLIVNKFIPNAQLTSVITPFIKSNLHKSPDAGLDFGAIRVGFAILKGLVLRNAPLAKDLFPILIDALSNPETGRYAAQGFSTLLQEEEVLSKANHCNISPLHKHKTFALSVPAIIDGFRNGTPQIKKNYLVALSGILQWLPYSAFEPDASSIAPLLLQTLDIQGEHDIKMGAIDKINTIMRESPSIIEEHAGSVITRLVNLLNLKAQDPAPPAVRAKALRCLSLLPRSLRLEVVLPFQKQVIKKLIDSLDDDRRAVRGEAVACRTKWINLDGNDEDEEE